MKKILIILVFLLPLILAAQIEVGTNFGIIAELPIDNRLIMNTIGARDSIVWRYEGLTVYVISDSTNYQLQGGTDNSNWMYLDNTFYSPWAQNGNHVYLSTTTDSVGIGTATPSAILEVAGRIEISNTGNSIFIGEDAGLNDDGTDNNNISIGLNALKANITGYTNIAIGRNAIELSTNSIQNTAIGDYAQNKNSTGSSNVSMGNYSLMNNLDGSNNTAIGKDAIRNNTSGDKNSSLGYQSLVNNITGTDNTAFGYKAGAYYAGALLANITPTSSVFIGFESRASTATGTNQIVIGANAIGNGSNTVTLGDDNVTDVYANEDGGAIAHIGKIQLAALNTAPATAASTGTTGEVRYDANHMYVCTATNTWKRSAIATW